MRLDLPVSRQRLSGELSVNSTKYDRFKALDFDGHVARGQWDWVIGNDWSGQVGLSEVKTLASLANIQGGVQSSTPNPLTVRRAYANAAYLLTPRWRLRGGADYLEHDNTAAIRKVNDVEINGLEFGVSYITPAQNSIGVGLRVDDASFPTAQTTVGGVVVDNAYRQHTFGPMAEWRLTGASKLVGRVGHTKREYDQLPGRDYSGTTGRLGWLWDPTGKLSFDTALFREISTVEEINVGFVLATGVAVRPTWRITERLELSGLAETSRRRLLGEADFALGTVAPRTDRLNVGAVSLAWRPARLLQVAATLRRETRSSDVAGADYKSNSASLSARLTF